MTDSLRQVIGPTSAPRYLVTLIKPLAQPVDNHGGMSQQLGQSAGQQGTTPKDSSRQREDASGNRCGSVNSAANSRNNSGPNPYLKTKIQTATPAELRLMLLDGAVRFAELGREGLVEKNYEKSFTNISRAEDIVMELLESLRPEVEPKICTKLNDLYLYLYLELVKASSERNVAVIDNVIKLLKYERETWTMVMKKLEDERGAAPQSATASADSADGSAAQHAYQSLSVSG